MLQTFNPSHLPTFLTRYVRLPYIIVGIAALYAAAMLLVFPRWTVDDAYISFRYAYNLAHYGELNWNVGYDPVEGYTGIVLPLLMAPVIALGGDPAVASQVLGFLAYVLSAVLLWHILIRMEILPLVRSIVLGLFLVTPALYTHVFSGLETMLFTALLLASFDALLKRDDALLAIVLLATSLTRPEGALLAALFLSVRFIQVIRQTQHTRTFLTKTVALFVLPGTLYFIWRWSYYGYPLPNTFYVKLNGNSNDLPGLYWFITHMAFPLSAALLTVPNISQLKKYYAEIIALFLFVGSLAYFYSRATLIMNYGCRFYMPLYPLSLILLSNFVGEYRRKLHRFILPLIPLAIQVVWSTSALLGQEKEWIGYYQDTLIHEHVAAANYIKEHVPANEWVILNDTGIMPYFTQLKTIDAGALNDELLAHTHDPALIRAYLGSFHAAVVVRPWFERDNVPGADPYKYMLDLSNYQLITSYKDPKWDASNEGFRLYLFLRKDLIK